MTAVIGLDLSLTCSGVALTDGSTRSIRPHCGPDHPARRLNEIIGRLDGCLRHGHPTIAIIEGYNPGGHQGFTACRLGELGGAVRLRLFELGIAYFEVAPAQLKKYATGNGGASKDEMVAAAEAAGGRPANHDEADAWWLRHMGVAVVTRHADDEHRQALVANLDWRI